MSSSSDSEDERLKLILEAADRSLLADSMFNTKKDKHFLHPAEQPKSQRHLLDSDNFTKDLIPPEAVQKLMSTKLATIVEKLVEFTAYAADDDNCTNKIPKRKSRVRLLHDFKCYVNPYEDFECEVVGLRKKPIIRRRTVDNDDVGEKTRLKCVAVDGESILSGNETKNWSSTSKGKVFCYKLGSDSKMAHFIEPDNEFTKLRRKNRWNESKIKTTKFLMTSSKSYFPGHNF